MLHSSYDLGQSPNHPNWPTYFPFQLWRLHTYPRILSRQNAVRLDLRERAHRHPRSCHFCQLPPGPSIGEQLTSSTSNTSKLNWRALGWTTLKYDHQECLGDGHPVWQHHGKYTHSISQPWVPTCLCTKEFDWCKMHWSVKMATRVCPFLVDPGGTLKKLDCLEIMEVEIMFTITCTLTWSL